MDAAGDDVDDADIDIDDMTSDLMQNQYNASQF